MVPERRIWVSTELKHDRSASVDHEVEPPVIPGHGEAFVGQSGRHSDPNKPHAVTGNDLTSHDCSTTAKR